MAKTTRDALCTAALDLFAERGIERTTVQDIADRAGAAQGALYRHFRGKNDLVECLFDICAERMYRTLQHAVDGHTEPRDRVRHLLQGVFEFAEHDEAAFTYLLSVHHTGILEEREEPPPPMRLFVTTIEAGIAEGTFRPLSPPLATGWVVAMAQRAVVFLRSNLVTDTREEIVDETLDGALRLLERDAGA